MSEQQTAEDDQAVRATIKEAYAAYVLSPRAQPPTPFDRYTERARKALILAQSEAFRFNHDYIGTEHLLLGLISEGDGVAAKVLATLGVELNRVRNAVEYIVGHGDRGVSGEAGLTPRAVHALALASDEARRLGHHYIGTEHLLLGLVREGEGIAAGALESLGCNLEKVRTQTIQILASSTRTAPSSNAKSNVVTCRIDDRDLDALDALVEAGIRTTRSDAASWLIRAGIDAHQALFTRVYATVAQIRELRAQAQTMAQALDAPSQAATTPSSPADAT
jgi:ATP-dependent Clp protease ATP-binding subunit ClpA